jgi:biopolymer transport protein ExbB
LGNHENVFQRFTTGITTMASAAARSRPRPLLLFLTLATALVLCAGSDSFTPRAAAQDPDEVPKAAPQHAGGHTLGEIIRHLITSVGWVFGFVLLVISIGLVTIVVLLVMELRMDNAVPPAFVEEFTDTVNNRRFKEAYDMAKEDTSFVARVLTAGMGRLQYGIEDAREASFSMLESVKAGKEQLIVYLATIGTLGPLLGLVGMCSA